MTRTTEKILKSNREDGGGGEEGMSRWGDELDQNKKQQQKR